MMSRIIFLLLATWCAVVQLGAADNNPRVVRLRGFTGLWLSPPTPLDGGNALVHWKKNETLGSTRVDSADSKDLVESGGVPDAAGKIDTSADYSGGGSFLQNTSFFNPGDTAFSFSGWLFANAHGATMVPMQRNDDDDSQYQLESNGTYWRWGVSSNGTDITTWVVSGVEITNSVWMFVAMYHDPANNLIGISANNETFVTAAHGGGVSSTVSALGLRFGIKNDTGGGAVTYFNGRTDSWTYWNRVLSQGDVSRLWNGGVGLDYPFP